MRMLRLCRHEKIDLILTYLQNHEFITRPKVDELLGVSQTTSSRILKRMLQKTLIVRDGIGRKTKYRLPEAACHGRRI